MNRAIKARSFVTYEQMAERFAARFSSGESLIQLELTCPDAESNDNFALRVSQKLKDLGFPVLVDYVQAKLYHFRPAPKGGDK